MNQIKMSQTQKGIFALKEEYKKRKEEYERRYYEDGTLTKQDKNMVYSRMWELDSVVRDLEELLK